MEIIKVFYSEDSELKNFEFAISGWYCKPAILNSLAFKLNCLFLCCSKYGCRKFLPKWNGDFPVYEAITYLYKINLKWIVLEFVDSDDSLLPWSDSFIRSFYETQKSCFEL